MQRLKEILEIAGKALILVAGICYVIGLIVINVHLSQYGFYSLSLLQLNYVSAGLWALLPILLVIFIIVFIVGTFFTELEKEKPTTPKRKYILVGLTSIVGVVGVLGLLSGLASSLGFAFGWHWVLVSGAGAVAGFLLLGAISVISQQGSFSTVKSKVNTILVVFITAFVFIAYVTYFARVMYKDLPASLGGGHPHNVRLVVDADAKSLLESAGLKFSSEPNKTEPTELIISTDKEYVLLASPSKNAVSVPNNLVKAVIFEKR